MSLVFLIGTMSDGRRVWYRGMNEQLDQYKRPVQTPVWDDEAGRQVELSFALDARDRWRAQGLPVDIVLEKYGAPIDERGARSPEQDLRQPQFVPFTNGLGLFATPGNTPKGQIWFVRAADVPAFKVDGRHTVIESVSGTTPVEAAQKAVDSWGQEILFADPEAIARAEAQRQQEIAAQGIDTPRNLRPGDR